MATREEKIAFLQAKAGSSLAPGLNVNGFDLGQAPDDGALYGQGKFRDTGRRSTNGAEALDSVVGAPVRAGIHQLTDPNGPQPRDMFDYGPRALNAAKAFFSQMGQDPRSAPTGYDIASKDMGINNPYLGAGVATLGDLAQLPIPGSFMPGIAGEIKGVKSLGSLADASEAFAARAKAAPTVENRIAQMYGETGDVRDAVKPMLERISKEQYPEAYDSPQYRVKSAFDNPKNAPPKAPDKYAFLDHLNPEDKKIAIEKMAKGDAEIQANWKKVDEQRNPTRDTNGNVISAPEFKGPGKDAANSEGFWHNENDHSYTDHAKGVLDSIVNRYGDDAPKIEQALKNISNTEGIDHLPYVGQSVHGKPQANFPLPNFDAKPTGVIGEPRIQGMTAAQVDPFAWMDSKYGAAKQLLQRHESLGMPAQINTSSDLIGRQDYIDKIPEGSTVNLHMLTGNGHLDRILFPGNASQARLEAAADALEKAGIDVNRIYPKSGNDVIKQAELAYGGKARERMGFDTNKALADKLDEELAISAQERNKGPRLVEGQTPNLLNAPAGASAAINANRQPDSAGGPQSRAEKLAYLQSQGASGPTREQKIAFLQAKAAGGQAPGPAANTGQAQTALESFGNGASMGYLPQLQALAEPVTTAIGNAFTGNNVEADDYTTARDANIRRQAQQREANPYTAGASGIAGGVVSGIAGSKLLPAPAATVGGRLTQAARIGAVYGGLSNPGDTTGEIDPLGHIPDRIMNAGKGMAFSAGTAGLIEAPGVVRNVVRGAQKTLANRVGQNVEFTPAPNAEEVKAAAKTLGIESTPKALLTDNPTFQKLESGLSQSGSLPAKSIRDQYNSFFKSLEDASNKISDLKSNESDFSLGKQIQGSMERQVEGAKAPVSEMYNDLTPHLRKIEVNEDVVNKAFGALKRNPIFQTKDGVALLEEYKAATLQQPELASLKEFRSTLRDSVPKSAAPLDAKRMDAIASAVTSIRNNTINALKEHMPADMHPEVDNLIGDISLADAAHKSNLDDINSVKSLVGNKPFGSQSAFLNKLSELKESELADRASSLDVTTLRNLKEKFPPVFDKAKTAIVNDMVKGSTSSVNGFNDTAFLKKYDALDQEMKDLVFEPKMQSHIEAVKTIKQAIPEKLGPSGTPEGKMMMDMFNPKRNALDYGVKKTLEATSGGPKPTPVMPESQSPTKTALQLIVSRPSVENTVGTQPIQKAAESKPTKGPDKWANDGLQKLEQHGAGEKILEKVRGAMNEMATKKLLIAASDLKPGSKAMDALIIKLKAKDGR